LGRFGVPIENAVFIRSLDQDAFHALDKEVMGHAFAIHNEMGRLFDETIYQAELVRRCVQGGMLAHREVMISAIHKSFRKDYFLDALFSNGAIYELKCVVGLTGGNESQLINYLLLAGVQHGKLINFRLPSVESRFVSTGLTREKRQAFQVDLSGCQTGGSHHEYIESLILSLLRDWGAFLSLDLYRGAVIHFLGGAEEVVRPVDVVCGNQTIGRKNICLLSDKEAVHLSAMTDHFAGYEIHLRRFLSHTKLDSILWINFNQDQVTFKTILRK
jgi:GxxExxY protein